MNITHVLSQAPFKLMLPAEPSIIFVIHQQGVAENHQPCPTHKSPLHTLGKSGVLLPFNVEEDLEEIDGMLTASSFLDCEAPSENNHISKRK
mmetsp:Transcript_114202/g.198532  ORF Transcript_114202/g.198532 Transcript_114202/m.198532 type:complete len:92 (-) Transcript_114202:252-527(-)